VIVKSPMRRSFCACSPNKTMLGYKARACTGHVAATPLPSDAAGPPGLLPPWVGLLRLPAWQSSAGMPSAPCAPLLLCCRCTATCPPSSPPSSLQLPYPQSSESRSGSTSLDVPAFDLRLCGESRVFCIKQRTASRRSSLSDTFRGFGLSTCREALRLPLSFPARSLGMRGHIRSVQGDSSVVVPSE
jgi:hypothetical protein